MLRDISIYDTTLRDGTQGEQVNLSAEDKLRIAKKLDEYGIPYIEALLEDLTTWLERHGYASLDPIQGTLATQTAVDPTAFQRANYIKTLQAYDQSHCH